ncbi:hypothetical protein [Nonomuraea sp. NPDC050783]|uniref:hypothetical protein n=1 Tax=Nonomuraea sp. NPDC050783 TaxID=3154634 RepID=UPI0034655812
MSLRRSTPVVFLVLAVLATVVVNLVATTGAYALPRQICTLQEDITYSPPLTNTPQTVTYTVHGQLTACTDSSAPGGHYDESGTATGASCTALLASGNGTRTFAWASGDHSEFQYSRMVNRVAGYIQVIATGTIGGGRYQGEPATSEGIGLQPDPLGCATVGVSHLTALGTVTIGL